MNKVLWNNEKDLCIGLTTEIDQEEFIEVAQRTHEELTGDELPLELCKITMVEKENLWKLEL